MEYSRFVPLSAVDTGLAETIEHVKAHLSEVVTADDDPTTLADQVLLSFSYVAKKRLADRGILVTGSLSGHAPVAAYLDPNYVPVDDGQFTWRGDDE